MALPTTNLLARFIATTGTTVVGGRVTVWADQTANALDAAKGTNGPWLATDYLGRTVVRFDNQANNGAASMAFGAAHTFATRNLAIFIVGAGWGGDLIRSGGSIAANLRVLNSGGVAGNPLFYYSISNLSTLKPRGNLALVGFVDGAGASVIYTNIEDSGNLGTVVSSTGTGITLAGGLDAYEILVYEGAVSTQDVADIKSYAAATYALRTSAYPKNIVFEGDSITAGLNNTTAGSQFNMTGYPALALMRSGAEAWKWLNLAVSGSVMAGLTARAAMVDNRFDATCARNVVLGLIGRNDATTDTAATIYSNIVAYVQARVAAGFEVWWGTAIASSSALQPTLDALNAKLRGSALGGSGPGLIADAGAARIIDFASLPQFDATAHITLANYQPDQTHPTPAGAKIMADLVAPFLVTPATGNARALSGLSGLAR